MVSKNSFGCRKFCLSKPINFGLLGVVLLNLHNLNLSFLFQFVNSFILTQEAGYSLHSFTHISQKTSII